MYLYMTDYGDYELIPFNLLRIETERMMTKEYLRTCELYAKCVPNESKYSDADKNKNAWELSQRQNNESKLWSTESDAK